MKTYNLSGNHDEDMFLNENDMSELHWEMLMGCHHQGQCINDVVEASRYFDFEDGGIEKAFEYLVSAGIEEEQFKDDENEIIESEVLNYYLWMIAGDIQDEKEEQ